MWNNERVEIVCESNCIKIKSTPCKYLLDSLDFCFVRSMKSIRTEKLYFLSLRWQRQLNICHWCDVWITILLFTNDFVSFSLARNLFVCFNLESVRFQCFCIGYCAIACSQAFADTSILCSFTVFVQRYRWLDSFPSLDVSKSYQFHFDSRFRRIISWTELKWFFLVFYIKNIFDSMQHILLYNKFIWLFK